MQVSWRARSQGAEGERRKIFPSAPPPKKNPGHGLFPGVIPEIL